MKSETKAKLKTIGKYALKASEFVLEDMSHTAQRQSKSKKFTEEQREQYASMADSLKSMSSSLSDYRERLEQADSSIEIDELDFDGSDDPQDYEGPEEESISNHATYDNPQKAKIQLKRSSSYDVADLCSVEEWDSKWVYIGNWSDIKKSKYNQVGLIRFVIGDDTVFITRAIELKRGGISQRLQELQNSIGKRSMIAHKISENYNSICVWILEVGDSDKAIDLCRNLEKLMVKQYEPLWLERTV